MADIKSSGFWVNLLKKILGIILKNNGVRTKPVSHNQHVVPHDEAWAVKGEGNEKFTAVYDYQQDAIERAREIAIGYGADVIVHRKDGSIRDRISYR